MLNQCYISLNLGKLKKKLKKYKHHSTLAASTLIIYIFKMLNFLWIFFSLSKNEVCEGKYWIIKLINYSTCICQSGQGSKVVVVVLLLPLWNVSNYSHSKPKNYLRSYTDVKYFLSGQSELAPTRTPSRMGREGKSTNCFSNNS